MRSTIKTTAADLCRATSGVGFASRFLTFLIALLTWTAIAAGQSDQANHRVTQGEVNDNATLSLGVPLASYPGRGLDLPVSLNYSSSVWRIEHWKSVKYYPPLYAGYIKQSITYPIFAERSAAGWRSSLNLPVVEWPKYSDTYSYKGKPSEFWNYRIAKVTIHMPDGSSHELRKSDVPYSGPIDLGGVFYAVDGSRMRYDSSGEYTGTLYMPDGTRYILNGSTGQIIDRHGNQMTYDGTYWIDTLGRVIQNPIPANPQAQDYTYHFPGLAGVNGGVQTYTLKWRQLAVALTPNTGGGTPALRVIASHYLPTPGSPPSDSDQSNYPQPQPTPSESLFQTATPSYEEEPDVPVPTMVVGNGHSAGQLFNPVVLTEIVLPDGTSYKFGYNVYGEIDKVTYPTGAYDHYDYAATITTADGFKQPYTQAERNIASRKQSIDGTGTDIREWTYQESQGESWTKTISITSPDTTKTDIDQYQPWVASDPDVNFAPFGLGDSMIGSTIERRTYSSLATGRTLLRRELTSYEQSTNTYQWTAPGITPIYTKTINARRNSRLARNASLVFEGGDPALARSSTFQYDLTNQFSTGVDQTQAAVYHFAVVDNQTAQTGSLTQIPLGTLAKYSETSYLNDAVYSDQNLLGLANVAKIKDAAGNVVSQSEMVYDECPQYCTTAGRALPASMKTWDGTKGSVTNPSAYLVTHAKFDQWGNRTEATDAKGFVTTTVYDTNYQTFPVQVISPVPDPTGIHGSTSAFTTTTTYDTPASGYAPLGVVVATTDANGQTTTMEYNDVLLRPTRVVAPNGHQTITEYGVGTSEATRWVKVRTQIDTNFWSEAVSKYDGVGRTYFTKKIDTQGNIATETEYDIMGRVLKSSNPYKVDASDNPVETVHWTTPEYDDLGRTKKVISPDTDDVQIAYALSTTGGVIGTTKTITDQAGKKRTGITNALGNMIRVLEDPGPNELVTDYVFDTLGNLRKTIQGEQSRYFMYDSLGRVLFAKQPEQDTNTAFVATDPITGNTSWSVKYTFDDNGNILTTTDARNISITGTYDRLDRLKTRDYYDPNTPDVSFYYDGKYLDAADNPQIATGSVKGKTTGVKSTVSRSNNIAFDSMGRLLTSQQITDGQTYSFGYTYNLSGELIEETYPSGRVVKNTLNANGELSQVQSRKNSNYGFFTYADSFSYNSSGAVTKMQLGNGRWETASFNDRLQITQIGLGVTSSDQNLLKLEFKYNTTGQTDNNGSMREQKITVPAVGANPGFTATQSYAYDSLNRIQSATENLTPIGGTSTQTWKQTFTFDRYGNRRFDAANTTTLGSCAASVCNPEINTSDNRLKKDQAGGSAVDYDYDANGALLKDFSGQRFGYDAESHQKEFFSASNQTTTPDATYHYDGEGRRVKKIVGTEMTIFVYNASGQLAAEYSTTVVPVEHAKVSYLTPDHLGSPRVVTDQNGAVISRKDFAAFGDEIVSPQRVGGTNGNGYNPPSVRQDYTGYQKDGESGLEFAQARYYNTGHGRFTSVDPLTASAVIKNPQTFNRYSYVLNSPHRFTDPLGLAPGGCGADRASCDGDSDDGVGSVHIKDGLAKHEGRLIEMQRALKLKRQAQDASNRGDYDAMWEVINNSNGLIAAELNTESVTVQATIQAIAEGASLPQSLFMELWNAHPNNNGHSAVILDKDGNPDPANQCAVKFAYMLLFTSLATEYQEKFRGTTKHGLAVNAGQMAKWVTQTFGRPVTLTGNNIAEQLAGRTGIVHLENFQGIDNPNQRYNHIDLWNGHAGRMSNGSRYNEWFNSAKKVTFWEVR